MNERSPSPIFYYEYYCDENYISDKLVKAPHGLAKAVSSFNIFN